MTDFWIEHYRRTANVGPLTHLSGRPDAAMTRRVNDTIRALVPFGSQDVVADIGRGDGTLLVAISPQIAKGLGIVPTDEECARLSSTWKHLTNISFRSGLVQDVAIADNSVSRVICNGVLLLLESAQEVERAMASLRRITHIGGLVWIGEIPHQDEDPARSLERGRRQPEGDSTRRWLRAEFRRHGVVHVLRSARMVVGAWRRAKRFTVPPVPLNTWFSLEGDFVRLACSHGLEVVWIGKYETTDVVRRATRTNYLFRRVS